jgi:hypothetical protein
MQAVSSAYRAEQKEYLREEGYIWVYLGVISKEAQAHAKPNGTFTLYSSPQLVNSTVPFEGYYAIPEENFIRADGTQYFLPRNKNSFALYQGLVTQEMCDSVTFTFGKYTHLDIKGLTIDFGDYYPTSFEITNGTYTYSYTNDKPGEWVTEDIFRDTDHITITPNEIVGGQKRFRIISILFGIGLMFDNNSLISTSWKSECSHVSNELPTKAFSFAIDNTNKRFAADDPNSYLAFLEEQQEVEFEYGRNLKDGTLYAIPGGKLRLKTWSSDDTRASFSAVGFLDYTESKYYKGKYYPNGISLYDLAIEVCQDAGIEKYTIDNYLQTMHTKNPLPIEKHKNLLQLIANASRSIMRETRDGGIEIKSSFTPDIVSVTTNGQTIYSNAENVFKEDITVSDYATSEKNFSRLDGLHYFLPRTSRVYAATGYISSHVSNANGTFSTNPEITIEWEAAWTFFGMSLAFYNAKPSSFTIYSYNYNELVSSKEYDEIDYLTVIEDDFVGISRMRIVFNKTSPYQRIHLSHVSFGDITDYVLDYSDMTSSPTASVAEKVKNVNVTYYEYSYGSSQKKISSTMAVAGNNVVTFKNPAYNYSLSYASVQPGTLTIISSGAYYVEFTSSIAAEVNITGIEFVVSTKEVTQEVRQIGTDKTASNVLIDNAIDAQNEAEWLADYFANDIDYIISYRGEPALDPDDLIYTENRSIEKNLVRITSTQIDTSTGMSMSCKLNARRVSYVLPAVVGSAIVGESAVH